MAMGSGMTPRITEAPMAGGMNAQQPDQQEDQQSSASAQAAYVRPTDDQPTICQNCSHFDGQGSCDHPQVIADPDVQGKVEANGHSKFYSAKSQEAAEGEAGLPTEGEGADKLASGAHFGRKGGYGLGV
jgi:hypothetical protein